tara:strand:- start:505 stop:795 length:291 start_codon:yes stop_codon:yes gene_type:complete
VGVLQQPLQAQLAVGLSLTLHILVVATAGMAGMGFLQIQPTMLAVAVVLAGTLVTAVTAVDTTAMVATVLAVEVAVVVIKSLLQAVALHGVLAAVE